MNKQKFDELSAELKNGNFNCIIVKGEEILKFSLPGVKTLMTLLRDDPGFLKDSLIFDKVVGRGAAALMIMGEVKEIYAQLISEQAISLLDSVGMKYTFEKSVPFIQNRTQTGLCPIEILSKSSDDPKVIHDKISDFLSVMSSTKVI